jgi:hypothetical protein
MDPILLPGAPTAIRSQAGFGVRGFP